MNAAADKIAGSMEVVFCCYQVSYVRHDNGDITRNRGAADLIGKISHLSFLSRHTVMIYNKHNDKHMS